MGVPRKIVEKVKQCLNDSITFLSGFSISSNSSLLNDKQEKCDEIEIEEKNITEEKVPENNIIKETIKTQKIDIIDNKDNSILNESALKEYSTTILVDSKSENGSYCEDKVVMSKLEYSNMVDELSQIKNELKMKAEKEKDLKKTICDYDSTLTFILEKEQTNDVDILKGMLRDKVKLIKELYTEIDKHNENTETLQSYIASLKNDLIRSKERADAFKSIGKEKIKKMEREVDVLRNMLEMEKDEKEDLKSKLKGYGTFKENEEIANLSKECYEEKKVKRE
ncbi:hypothetical protein SLOPH_1856 [Spraguea lophii 42_110]|uniref:Uncharacterized protein n=1 Tax=Spraguea lophii (strain 42_110) TaxID=1358809 RepID=S7XT36_SPRLO|nr:hypothetical protein SLOPH_1856 [Spraguea lophii 42_110]